MARQGELFSSSDGLAGLGPAPAPIPLEREQLLSWQQLISAYQAPRFEAHTTTSGQGSLFGSGEGPSLANPLRLSPQTLHFWRWPTPPQQGAALYFVIDQAPVVQSPLILYVGETCEAGRRWKGEHDCKAYLAAYSDALAKASLSSRLSIRFDLDVPSSTRARRALELALIRHWQPPFNKETRGRWATPFTADPPS